MENLLVFLGCTTRFFHYPTWGIARFINKLIGGSTRFIINQIGGNARFIRFTPYSVLGSGSNYTTSLKILLFSPHSKLAYSIWKEIQIAGQNQNRVDTHYRT